MFSKHSQEIGIWWGLNAMMFQYAEKMSFSRFPEYFILLLLLLFIYCTFTFLPFSYFCINFCVLYCSVISVLISPLLLLIVYCTVCGLLY